MGKIEDFLEAINKPYAGQVAQIGGHFAALRLKRFTSGVLTLDVALGGGWPFSRVAMVAGEESTGKTLLALKAMAAVEAYDHSTKQHKSQYEGDIFRPGRALFIDAEGCISGSDRVFDPVTGQFHRMDDVVKHRKQIHVQSVQNGKLCVGKVVNWFDNGVNEVFKVTTANAASVTATANHRLLVFHQGCVCWKRVDELTQEMWVSRPRRHQVSKSVCYMPDGGFEDENVFGVCFDRVVSVDAVGKDVTYDITVAEHHNFVVNDFVVHNSFDVKWALANGFNEEHHVVARTEFAEQAIDIVTKAIQENHFDLIIIDSLAALTPSKEIEESAEDWQIGLRARMLNKAISRWNSSLVGMSQQNSWGPLVLCLNQFRINIGQMYGDPRVMPGGKAQKFFTSLILYTKSPKYDDKKIDGRASELGKVTLSGVVHKNKTYMPRMNYAFDFALKATDDAPIGTINNVDALMDLGKKYKLIVTKGGKVHFGKKEFGTQKEMKQMLAVSKELYRSLWISIVRAATGY